MRQRKSNFSNEPVLDKRINKRALKDKNYFGEVKNHKRHGNGKCNFPNGAYYEGEWYNDKPHGQGDYTYASKQRYIGSFVEGKRC